MTTSPATKGQSTQDPLTTGLDFLTVAVTDLADHQERTKLKFGLVNLFTGIEILLKVRLAREHWSLVFRDVSKASKPARKTGDFRSVEFDSAIDRLSSICDVQFSKEHRQALRAVSNDRNALMHIGYMSHPSSVRPIAAKALNFMISFIADELEPYGIPEDASAFVERLRNGLSDINHFVDERTRTISPLLQASTTAVVQCCMCFEFATTIDGGVAKCEFCEFVTSGEDAAYRYVRTILGLTMSDVLQKGGTWPVHTCKECDEFAFVEMPERVTGIDTHWACFACGVEAKDKDVMPCTGCHEPMIITSGSGVFCSDCPNI